MNKILIFITDREESIKHLGYGKSHEMNTLYRFVLIKLFYCKNF